MHRYAAVAMLLLLSSCGKKGPLVYPEMLVPAAPTGLEAHQVGGALRVSFNLPSHDLAGRSISRLADLNVFRKESPARLESNCLSCTSDFILFTSINLDKVPSSVQQFGSRVVLPDDAVVLGRTYSYRVSTTTSERKDGAVSNPAIATLQPVYPGPALQVFNQPTEVVLEFVSLPSQAASVIGHNVYRSMRGVPYPYMPINSQPLKGNRYVDSGLDRNQTYVYRVRGVLKLENGTELESEMSNEVEGRLKDDE